MAFGAGPDVAIAGGTGNAIFTAGNKYFAPQQRTAILASAVDALACIQAEASGVDAFDKPKPPEVHGALESVAGGTVELADERRYYNMVNSVVNTVHGIATRRLSTRGSFDAAGIAGEMKR